MDIKVIHKIGLIALLTLWQIALQSQTMLIDEDFSDWNSTQLRHTDILNDGIPGSLDFHRLWITDDTENIYLRIELGLEIEIQEFDDLFIYIDLDNNVNTGFSSSGFQGADLLYGFGIRGGILRLGSNNFSIFHNDIGLVTLPTVSSAQFEISFAKRIDYFQGVYTINANTIRIALVDERGTGDRIPNIGAVSYGITNEIFAPPPFEFQPSHPEDIRIVSYNVLSDGLFDAGRQPSFRRILRALSPQIIGFQEIYDNSSLAVAQLMEVFLPSALNEQWYHAKVSPDIILVSRFPITNSASTDGNGIFEVQLPDKKIIIANAHFPCCNNDTERQVEIDRLMGFIRNSIDGSTNIDIPDQSPIFVIGDMNLVGLERQQRTLITGDIQAEQLFGSDFDPDWDGSPFDDALPFSTGSPHAVTWYNPSGSFSAGRLDYILFTGSVAERTQAFALNTSNLTPAQLNTYNLLRTDVEVASDHFPCVADFNLDPSVSTTSISAASDRIRIWPNPVADILFVELEGQPREIKMELIDADGNTMMDQVRVGGENRHQVDLAHLPSGFYLLRVYAGDEYLASRKIIKH